MSIVSTRRHARPTVPNIKLGHNHNRPYADEETQRNLGRITAAIHKARQATTLAAFNVALTGAFKDLREIILENR